MDRFIKKVAVAMSGGVDSSVTAALLQEQGYEIFGIIMRLWNEEPHRVQESIDIAQAVCHHLRIQLKIVDLRDVFRQKIVGYYLKSQLDGRTPNPCFVCNQEIKWGLLLDESLNLGADLLATGHYARIIKNENGEFELYKGTDPKKDQSYVLAGLSQYQLSKAILPLGSMKKQEVIEIARRYKLPVRISAESQDLCFLGGIDQNRFLTKYLGQKIPKGKIISADGDEIGEHTGLVHYTIGQRKGLGSGNSEPIYVLQKIPGTNTLIVGTKQQLGCRHVQVRSQKWISGYAPSFPVTYTLRIRYKATPVLGKIMMIENGKLIVEFDSKVRDATPGQFIVFYDGDRVIGSAEIDKIFLEE